MQNQKILNKLYSDKATGKKSLAVLIDPDKLEGKDSLLKLIEFGNENYLDYFFIGGSLITTPNIKEVVSVIKNHSKINTVLFPGNSLYIDAPADSVLFLSLISGRNPEFLIGQHVVAAPLLKNSQMEVLPTGYMLINSDSNTSVSYMSNTRPIPSDKYSIAASTAIAGEMLGLRLIYLDAGSGGIPIHSKMISSVRKAVETPLIVGGGIDSPGKAMDAFDAGADVIVIGNAIEKNPDLLIEVSEKIYDRNSALNIH